MKKLFLFCVSFFSLFAATPAIDIDLPKTTAVTSTEKKQRQEKNKGSFTEIEKGIATKTIKESSELMIISPEGRAKDFQTAIQFLKQKVPASKPNIKLINGSIITGIVNVDVMPEGTLLIFKIASLKGLKYRIEKVENIDTIVTNET